jgi:hypothetical protein
MKEFEVITQSQGEPIARLAPADFHMYQAALEKLGVPSEDARRRAAESRILYSPTSKARAQAITTITNGHTNENSIRHEGHRLDTKIEEAVRGSIAAIGAVSVRTPELQPVRVGTLPTSGVVYRAR